MSDEVRDTEYIGGLLLIGFLPQLRLQIVSRHKPTSKVAVHQQAQLHGHQERVPREGHAT
jgi:hypothetical protein